MCQHLRIEFYVACDNRISKLIEEKKNEKKKTGTFEWKKRFPNYIHGISQIDVMNEKWDNLRVFFWGEIIVNITNGNEPIFV